MTIKQELVLQEIRGERLRQDALWGGPAHDDALATEHFLNLIRDRLENRIRLDLENGHLLDARRRLVQVAAIAVAAIESMDRKASS